MTAILNVLEKTLFKPPAHLMLHEVRNATGFAHSRTADALVVSLWPSRGIWFACVEVKVSRSDWLRELVAPEKAEAISQYCEYMWLATTPGIVQEHEVPVAWGLIEVKGQKAEIVKKAPHRKTKPLKPAFVAAVLRNRGDYEAGLKARMRDELRQEHVAAVAPVSADVAELRRALQIQKLEFERVSKQLEHERETLKTFEAKSGIHVSEWNAGQYGEALNLALRWRGNELERVANQFTALAAACRKAHRELVQLPLALEPKSEETSA